MDFKDKKVGETLTLGFDLVRMLSAGETIATAGFAVLLLEGSDPAPNAMVSGVAAIDGSKVRNKIVGGVAGCYYRVQATITTSAGNVYQPDATLRVSA